MAARPVWKGQLRLSLVAIPVEMYSAVQSGARISFRQIHEKSGKPVRYQKVVPGIGPVDKDAILKGYEIEEDRYVLLSDEEIEDVRLETKKTFELTQFVGACEIDPLYFNKPYFLVPQDDLAEDAFRVVRDALRATEKIGLGQLALRGREYLAALKPCGTGLLLETLYYEDEIRQTDPVFASISGEAADDELLDVAKRLIESKTAPFDAEIFKDHYTEALKALIERKTKGRRKKTVDVEDDGKPAGNGNVVDLMAALKQSLEKSEKPPARSRKRASQKKSAAPSRKRKSA
jgi:DNA end-binding protein Ku